MSHAAYEKAFGNYMAWVRAEDRKAPLPDPVARAILKACQSRSPGLRYPVGETMMLGVNRLLPDRMWRALMAAGMTRQPRS